MIDNNKLKALEKKAEIAKKEIKQMKQMQKLQATIDKAAQLKKENSFLGKLAGGIQAYNEKTTGQPKKKGSLANRIKDSIFGDDF
jgi:hypothetical protein